MKKYLFLPAIIAALLSACKPIDPVSELNVYNDCVVYSVDTINSGEEVATDFAKIKVTTNVASNSFDLGFVDFKLRPDENVQTFTAQGLTQYLYDVENEDGTTDYLYTFFKSEGQANTDGGVSVRDLRFGWLSTVYWCTFASGQNRVWSLPRDVRIHANRNVITNSEGKHILENSLHPRYDMAINTAEKTISLTGRLVKFPSSTDAEKPGTRFDFREIKIENIPVRFTPKGLIATGTDIMAVTDGRRDGFKITDFTLLFEVAYEGDHKATFNITDLETGETLKVESTFGYDD